MKKVIWIIVAVIFGGLFVFTGYYFIKKNQSNPVVYNVEKPFKTDIIKKTVATGSVVPREEIELKPMVSGIIEELYVEPGENVMKGDLIAKIRIIPNLVSLNAAEAELKRATINYEESKKELERQHKLFEQELISEQTYLQFQFTNQRNMESKLAAQDKLQILKEGATSSTARATNLVRSTVNGMVLDVPVKEGSSVIESNTFNDGTTIASVANLNEMIFEGKIDESEVGKLNEGMDLLLTIAALPDEQFAAKLDYISPKGIEDEGTIKFEIKATVNLQNDKFLRAGYSANADIVLEKRDSVLSIKESLLQFDEEENTFVEIQVEEQTFERRFVELGLSDGINVEIIDGVSADDNLKGAEKTEEDEEEPKGERRGRSRR